MVWYMTNLGTLNYPKGYHKPYSHYHGKHTLIALFNASCAAPRNNITLAHFTSTVFEVEVEGLSDNAAEYAATASSFLSTFDASSPILSSVVTHRLVNSDGRR